MLKTVNEDGHINKMKLLWGSRVGFQPAYFGRGDVEGL
jgi:hypothetical protein